VARVLQRAYRAAAQQCLQQIRHNTNEIQFNFFQEYIATHTKEMNPGYFQRKDHHCDLSPCPPYGKTLSRQQDSSLQASFYPEAGGRNFA
jgi:hypothetical protein